MIELKRCLSEKQNIFARLFHIELKDIVEKGLEIMQKMPQLSARGSELEHYNSRVLLELRNDFLSHTGDRGNYMATVFNFVILLCEGDEYCRQRIDWLIQEIKVREFHLGETPRASWWRE